jgi:hypothetical protein
MRSAHPWPRAGLTVISLLALGAVPTLACSDLNTPIYLNGPTPLLELQGTEMIPRITNSVTLQLRAPNDSEKADLEAQKKALGFAVPWASRDKLHLEVLFTVTNLETDEDGAGTFDVVVDGANEYTKYDETVVAAAIGQGKDDAPVYVPLMSLHPQLPQTLAPGAVYQGVMREDDFNEGEGDLDALGRWMANYASVLINRSDVNPIGLEMVPPDVVTPALIEVDVTLTANKHMKCEWTLRVRDDDDRLWHVTGDPKYNPPAPKLFVPMAPPKT